MDSRFRNLVGFIAVVVVALGLAGCSSLRPISSDPPASAVVITAPFTIDQMSKASFPAGEYRPLYEDEGGFYYQAPTKVVANALFPFMYDGGVYVKRDGVEPAEWYVVGQSGLITMGLFKTVPPHEMKP